MTGQIHAVVQQAQHLNGSYTNDMKYDEMTPIASLPRYMQSADT